MLAPQQRGHLLFGDDMHDARRGGPGGLQSDGMPGQSALTEKIAGPENADYRFLPVV